MTTNKPPHKNDASYDLIAQARQERDKRDLEYRERALKLFPHVCGRCSREFSGKKLRELTVHHKDHNHENNPPDGSNWELLCMYCHDDMHQRMLRDEKGESASSRADSSRATHQPFAGLDALLKNKK